MATDRLTVQDWTAAALASLADGGVAAVAVEPIAASLGATKGSFYWHFRNRDALLQAALERWERTETDDVITLVDADPDPRRRLHTLLTVAVGGHPDTPGGNRVEVALQANAADPRVAPVLRRVTRRRLDYLAMTFAALGFDAPRAWQRSLLAYTAYVGHAQLGHATPEVVPHGPDLAAYIDEAIATLAGA